MTTSKNKQERTKDAQRKHKKQTKMQAGKVRWKRNKEVEERNGAGLLRSSVVSQTATIVTLEKVQHIKNFREDSAQAESIWYLPGAFVKEYNIVVGIIISFIGSIQSHHSLSFLFAIPVCHSCPPFRLGIPV